MHGVKSHQGQIPMLRGQQGVTKAYVYIVRAPHSETVEQSDSGCRESIIGVCRKQNSLHCFTGPKDPKLQKTDCPNRPPVHDLSRAALPGQTTAPQSVPQQLDSRCRDVVAISEETVLVPEKLNEDCF